MPANGTVTEETTLSPKTIRSNVFSPSLAKAQVLIAGSQKCSECQSKTTQFENPGPLLQVPFHRLSRNPSVPGRVAPSPILTGALLQRRNIPARYYTVAAFPEMPAGGYHKAPLRQVARC